MFDRQLKHAIAGHMARGNELMSRIDVHMDRGNELMSRIDVHMDRGNELMGEVRHEIELSRRDRADLVVFIRDITTRLERHGEATVRAIDAQTEATRSMQADSEQHRELMERQSNATLDALADLAAEIRSWRQGPGPASA